MQIRLLLFNTSGLDMLSAIRLSFVGVFASFRVLVLNVLMSICNTLFVENKRKKIHVNNLIFTN